MIVLDTHILVWWLGAERTRLSSAAARAIEHELAGGRIAVSSISAWEIAMLVQANRLDLSLDIFTWLETASRIERLEFVPVDNLIGVGSRFLPGEFHADPADRIIMALARGLEAPLVTADTKIRDYPHVVTIW
ncbi:type II toxin-antitoxin system VapC family toxin [Mesorhizobium sp. A623]